ncbi:MAG: molybdopterin-binding protein [Anaerolineae bacterium]|nr:molybdopterin-binding protein [Anaerolineae bacterium]
MKFGPVSVEQAVGKILAHNHTSPDGRRAFRKGYVVQAQDVPALQELVGERVYVAELDPDDVHEDAAARRLAETVVGEGVRQGPAAGGRVNLIALERGVLALDLDRLDHINVLDGLTVATLRQHTVVQPRTIVATVKVIPYAVPEAHLRQAEALAGPIVGVRPLPARRVGVVLTSSDNGRAKTVETLEPPIRGRVEDLGSQVITVLPVAHTEDAVAGAIRQLTDEGAEAIIIGGETSIMDAHDITPQGVRQAGGVVEGYGAPAEPGNLLLLAYLGDRPVLGAPGCVRSRHTNVVDLVLPRLLAGERLTRRDLAALGHGALLHE